MNSYKIFNGREKAKAFLTYLQPSNLIYLPVHIDNLYHANKGNKENSIATIVLAVVAIGPVGQVNGQLPQAAA